MKEIIRPEPLADKCEAIENFEDIELAIDFREKHQRPMLWAIQGKSIGGNLQDFIAKSVDRFPHLFGRGGKNQPGIPKLSYHHPGDTCAYLIPQEQWLESRFWRPAKGNPEKLYGDSAFMNRLCTDAAREFLEADLAFVCRDKKARLASTWYCPDLHATLAEMLRADASDCENSIAKTEVRDKVFDALNFAIAGRNKFVRVDGNSRWGKSESAKAHWLANPGRVRYLAAPSYGSLTELFQAIAEALGMQFDDTTSRRSLALRIDRVLRHSKILLVIDEAHSLIVGGNVTRNSRPLRLDWVRTALVDKGYGAALVTTPQVFNPEIERFNKITRNSYNFGQVFGRFDRTIPLPETISQADALSIVQHKAPEFSAPLHKLIEGASAKLVEDGASADSKNYLANVSSLVETARWFCQKAGRVNPTTEDVLAAIKEKVPASIQRETPAYESPRSTRTPKTAARNVAPTRTAALETIQRGVTPTAIDPPHAPQSNGRPAPIPAAPIRAAGATTAGEVLIPAGEQFGENSRITF